MHRPSVRKRAHDFIASVVRPNSRVLDLGCGNGDLLEMLVKNKNVRGTGVEIIQSKVKTCLSRGLSVHQGNIDQGLADYPDGSFDYVILSQTIQETKKPLKIMKEVLRVGEQGIVSFPNFAYLRNRWQLGIKGHAPISKTLPFPWYDTPNIHFLSISDFKDFCHKHDFRIIKTCFLNQAGVVRFFCNLRAELGIFLLKKGSGQEDHTQG